MRRITRAALVASLAATFAAAGAVSADHHEGAAMPEAAAGPPSEPAAVPEAAAAPPAETPATESVGEVARAQFTSSVTDREPVDALDQQEVEAGGLHFFTELREFQGQTVVHRWEWNDEVMAEVAFEVGGPRWRVWSSKELEPSWLGQWTVSVLTEDGSVAMSRNVEVIAAPVAAPAPTTP